MAFGYCGKTLRVNLENSTIKVENISEILMRKYFGGKGLITYYLVKEVNPGIDPLSPENKLIFANGIMTGVPVAGMVRFAVGAKSPLTGGYGQTEAGGFWGPELKMAGYDVIILEGKAPKPVYLLIKDGEAQIKDASHLWGKRSDESEEMIRQENNDKRIRVAQIGQAGENLVRYSCIINELKHANGRTGMGAVMGSKNLKAIAVRGKEKIEFKDKAKVMAIAKWYNSNVRKSPVMFGLYDEGTSNSVNALNKAGILPTLNFKKGYFENGDKISGPYMRDTILKKRSGCYACIIQCKREVEVDREDLKVDSKFGGPEYETIAAFGSLCGIDDIQVIAKAHELCNKYTLDSISTGGVIAFAIECYENGILTKESTNGLELRFGNSQSVLKLIEMIAMRDGIGDLLAEGAQRAAEKIGRGAEKFAMTVKNQELPLHDPRGKTGVGIAYAVSDTGAEHMQAPHDSMFQVKNYHLETLKAIGIEETIKPLDLNENKVRVLYLTQLIWCFYNMAGICMFAPAPRGILSFEQLLELIQAVTGWDVSLTEIMKASKRSLTMSRAYNLSCGFTYKDDRLPDRLHEPLEDATFENSAIDREKFQKAIKIYYGLMDWDEEGVPLRDEMDALDVSEIEL
ncbi:MAG: aldehyde ferredoxin oxidoreductase family protein [Clostridia bacterium]|nr:aldehyde ferredoxin oxidoreductase family protein [Clostridia bacterium]